LIFVGGDIEPVAGSNGNIVPVPLAGPNEVVHISIDIIVPDEPGRYRSTWRLQTAEGNRFGPRIWIDLIASEANQPSSAASSEVSQSGNTTAPPSPSDSSSSFPYASQLEQLVAMGFTGDDAAKQLLIDMNGDIQQVIAFMLANPTN